MTSPTLLCVHAHPDDESLFTAGITSHYAERGVRNVLVTCTMGQLGIDDHGRAGADPGHDAAVTRATRAGLNVCPRPRMCARDPAGAMRPARLR